ncbi:hypothetical protein Q6348_07630 [Isoptericola sp. b441]|uniref:DUF6602 domain-containing protein n=1 Tax=Actinotalea lenta TaxID=3064654 RepID=A0ABT9DDK1_9CELL|nr:DUF6602 domain-containing protein [Isoptericola sp. b441]MDO8107067.1 hypothetical protein [Isoptericola sp. b441]
MAEDDRLAEWIAATTHLIAANYDENHAKATDPARVQQVGHSAETAWKSTLEEWLPPQYEIGTRKYILPEVDTETYDYRETDLIVFRPGYPTTLRGREEVLASGVLAAFSVKLTLDAAGLRDAVGEAARIRRHTAQRLGTPRRELTLPFRFGVLAHSHRFGNKPHAAVTRTLAEADQLSSSHPRESLDLVAVADLGVWSKLTGAYHPVFDAASRTFAREWYVSTTFVEHATRHSPEAPDGWPPKNELDPIVVFLGALYQHLAIEDEFAEPFSSGLIAAGKTGPGSGPSRQWAPKDVFHESTLTDLPRKFVNGRGDREWAMAF